MFIASNENDKQVKAPIEAKLLFNIICALPVKFILYNQIKNKNLNQIPTTQQPIYL